MAKTFEASGFLKTIAAGALLLAAAPPARADAPRYRFTTILDSQRDGLEATGCAAINTAGTVAVKARDTALGIETLLTKRGAADAPTVIADNQPAEDLPTLCDNGLTSIPSDPSINEKGEVAFQGNPRRLTTRDDCNTPEQRRRRQGVFVGKGGPLTAIAHTINGPGNFISEFLVADQSLDTSGRVALVPELDATFEQGLFVASKTGAFDERYLGGVPTGTFTFRGTSSRVSLNEVGQVAFEDTLVGSQVRGIFLSNPDGTFATVADDTGPFASVSAPSLNLFGRVAFEASRIDQGRQVFGIHTARNGQLTTVAESNPDPTAPGPVYASFREPSLNDLGHVAFTADILLDPTIFRTTQGVFTGPDPIADRVLVVGDTIQGIPVTSVVTCTEGLNNLGQIAMVVRSQDPDTFEVRTLVVRATPNF